ncbi:hypothetical protein AGIG_G21585 [Arapaima gigas]
MGGASNRCGQGDRAAAEGAQHDPSDADLRVAPHFPHLPPTARTREPTEPPPRSQCWKMNQTAGVSQRCPRKSSSADLKVGESGLTVPSPSAFDRSRFHT